MQSMSDMQTINNRLWILYTLHFLSKRSDSGGSRLAGQAWKPGLGYRFDSRFSTRSYVKVYCWKQWVLNNIIFGESWNNGAKPWVFVLNQIPFVFPHKVIECSPDQIFPRLYWL
jgi:hypothetical protein